MIPAGVGTASQSYAWQLDGDAVAKGIKKIHMDYASFHSI